jgi:hypothetical protein
MASDREALNNFQVDREVIYRGAFMYFFEGTNENILHSYFWKQSLKLAIETSLTITVNPFQLNFL